MLKKLIIKLSFFFAMLVLLDLMIGSLVKKLYFKQDHGVYYRTTYVLESATPEIMILGSSKAAHHYMAAVIQDTLKSTCYNGGRDGSFISYSNAALNCMLKRYRPRMVVLDILDDEFEEKSYKIQEKLSPLLPYYRNHPEIRAIVEFKGPFEKYKLLSGMYTFNTLLLPAITGTLDLNNKRIAEKSQGFLPFYGKWDGEIKITDSHDEKLNSNKIQALRNIVAACKEKNVRLVIVVSPSYKTYVQNYSPTIGLVAKIADSSGVPFWNFIQDTTYLNHKEYFNDIRHLNRDGATIFTEDIIKKLKVIY